MGPPWRFQNSRRHGNMLAGKSEVSAGPIFWRDGRVVEGAPLLREYRLKRLIEGSNPSLSAKIKAERNGPF